MQTVKIGKLNGISAVKNNQTGFRKKINGIRKLFNHVGLKHKFSEDQLLTKDKKNKLSQKHNHNIYGGLWRGKLLEGNRS
jgi:hypothetical protein